ncbi:MFS transporter, partial [Streptomyces sparsus]
RQPGGRRLDVPGALLVTCGLGALAFGVVRTESAGWTAPGTLVALGGGLVLLTVFVLVELRARSPLMPPAVFRSRAVSAANAALFTNGAAMFCMWYFMSLYMQNVLDYTPVQAGLAFVPQSLSIVVGATVAPRLMLVVGARNVAVLAALTAAVGYLWQSGMHAEGAYLTTVLGPGVLMALGAGLASTPLATLATAGAAPGDAGLVSGLVNTSRTMGGSLGLAVLSTVAAARTAGAESPAALAEGYALAFRSGAGILLAGVVLMIVTLPRTEKEAAHE